MVPAAPSWENVPVTLYVIMLQRGLVERLWCSGLKVVPALSPISHLPLRKALWPSGGPSPTSPPPAPRSLVPRIPSDWQFGI